MARLKVTARPIGSEDVGPSEEEKRQLSEGEEDLSNVEADPSELMGSREKPPPILFLVSRGRLRSWLIVMRRRDILALEFVARLRMKLLLTLVMESAWCFGISLLLDCVFHWIPCFRRFWLGLVFGCTT